MPFLDSENSILQSNEYNIVYICKIYGIKSRCYGLLFHKPNCQCNIIGLQYGDNYFYYKFLEDSNLHKKTKDTIIKDIRQFIIKKLINEKCKKYGYFPVECTDIIIKFVIS